MTFAGKVVVVTGAAGGIGRATAVAFAALGARLAICDINERGCIETASTIGARGGEAFAMAADVGRYEEVSAFFRAVVGRFDTVHTLVNNAGIGGDGRRFPDTTRELWSRILAINLDGAFFCCKCAVPLMANEGGGSIINTASVLAEATLPGGVPYTTSKAALVGFTKALAHDLGSLGIRVNCLLPGSTDTDMLWKGVTEESRTNIEAEISRAQPLGRIGLPEEIAHATLFLASEAASFITGACLPVDGGLLTRLATTR